MDIFRTGVVGWGGGLHSPFHSFWGCFSPHYKGDLNTTKLTTKRPILAQKDQINDARGVGG